MFIAGVLWVADHCVRMCGSSRKQWARTRAVARGAWAAAPATHKAVLRAHRKRALACASTALSLQMSAQAGTATTTTCTIMRRAPMLRELERGGRFVGGYARVS